jgi:hypothetical protein
MKNIKICLNAMVGNESSIIERMLDSCCKYIDYWIIQCNGSDNTQEIVENFFKEKNIPGYCYTTEWLYPGWNSDHLVQECYKANHECDWLLRVDADEKIQVDENFNWSVLEDTSVQSWDVAAELPNSFFSRNRIWNAKIPWRFKHDKRHECIILPGCGPTEEEFQRIQLDVGFKHIITNDGDTWFNPTKFLTDALELENQKITSDTLFSDLYHFFYIGKSYSDCYSSKFPLGHEHQKEYARRCIFYCESYISHTKDLTTRSDEMCYYSQYMIGEACVFCQEYDKAIEAYEKCNNYCAKRNEHICGLAELYRRLEKNDKMLEQTEILISPERKNPFPDLVFLIHNHCYNNTGSYCSELHEIAKQLN